MALWSLRLRRTLTLSSQLFRNNRCFSSITSSIPQSHPLPSITPQNPSTKSQICWFRSSVPRAAVRSRYSAHDDSEKISEDTILFEGCDYNHWLITMDFPKDPAPTPDEMVETYVQTLAKVVGSVEEAKKRMYACSTTTYNGFQATMTEEMSEKFRGLPGVVFILPDSYIDPVNKEYGGDKYINGTIIPRPPPVQYGRQGRNREYSPRRDSMPRQQGSQSYGPQGSPQGVRENYAPVQGSPQGERGNYPQQQNYRPSQNFGPSSNQPGDQTNYRPQQNYPPQQNYGPSPGGQGDGRSFGPRGNYAPQQNYPPQQNYAPQQNYPPQQNYASQQNYLPQQNYGSSRAGQSGDSAPTSWGRDVYQVDQRDTISPPVARTDSTPPENTGFRGDNSNFGSSPAGNQEGGY